MLTIDERRRAAGRTVSFEVPVDTSLFTPLQLQPRSGFALGMTGWAQWLREHWVPFPRLIREHGIGVVIASLDLEYLRPFTFFDADALVVTAAVTVRTRGNLLFVSSLIRPADGSADIVRMAAVLRPVRIGDGFVLSATPGNLDRHELRSFEPEEIVSTGGRLRVRAMASEIESTHVEIARGSYPLRVHRGLCEAADQWSAISLPDLAADVREQLDPSAALVQPLRRAAMEFRRPAFLLDNFTDTCSVFEQEGGVVFVHRVTNALDAEPLATFVEWIGCDASITDPRACSD